MCNLIALKQFKLHLHRIWFSWYHITNDDHTRTASETCVHKHFRANRDRSKLLLILFRICDSELCKVFKSPLNFTLANSAFLFWLLACELSWLVAVREKEKYKTFEAIMLICLKTLWCLQHVAEKFQTYVIMFKLF